LLDNFFGLQDIYNAITAPNLNAGVSVVEGVLAGVATDTACNFVLGLADVPTAGLASVLGETACTLAGAAADSAVG
jgi:hypothetical protein